MMSEPNKILEIDELQSVFREDENYNKSDNEYFEEIVTGVVNNIITIDDEISKTSEIDIKNINFVELSIIRCFIFELNGTKEIPKEILLAESVKLASKFGGQDSYKFINAFLDNFVKNDTNENN